MSVWVAPGWVAALRRTRGSCVACTTRAERSGVDKGLVRAEGVVWACRERAREGKTRTPNKTAVVAIEFVFTVNINPHHYICFALTTPSTHPLGQERAMAAALLSPSRPEPVPS
ncbi:hypothetical protein Q8A67_024270 [Cirrhinus molitorella]|uniref:Uncharacterized protein n=1 Tax=Cirrhinus molitorella TaxID=172907 RepID=A0AA88P365_9TELE|nr:hypothetical protein Q8A67_024270 [Cirrhinus molitorella]